MRNRKWKKNELIVAVASSASTRQVLQKLGLVEAGGNYDQIKKYIKELNLSTKHFKGQSWNKGLHFGGKVKHTLPEILIENSSYQSYKLKQRLFKEGLKTKKCEECSWSKMSEDGRLPLELDHINGNRHDNRLENLRVLCPNCHSLKLTHRGKNRKRPGGGIGIHATLKML